MYVCIIYSGRKVILFFSYTIVSWTTQELPHFLNEHLTLFLAAAIIPATLLYPTLSYPHYFFYLLTYLLTYI